MGFQDNWSTTSRKYTYIILTPLTPLLYSKTGVYRGKHYFFLFLLKTIHCGYLIERPHQGSSNEYPQFMIEQKYEKYQSSFIWKFSFFGGEIFYIFE